MGDPLLRAKDLVTHLFTDSGTVQAVDGVSLHVGQGEAVALVGESGCGKSMTALSLMRLVRTPGRIVSGEVTFEGRNLLHCRSARCAGCGAGASPWSSRTP
jgi:peptide/nickel transport system ATP-binding protein